jgi:hypothetical protein
MRKIPKGFTKNKVALTSGDAKFNNAPTHLDYQINRLINLRVDTNFYEKNEAIYRFGSIEKWRIWREEEIRKFKLQEEKRLKKREKVGEKAYQIPKFSRHTTSPSYTIGEDGIAKQRNE